MYAHLIDEVFALDIGQVGALLVIRKVRSYSLRHDPDGSAIVPVHPVRAANQLVRGIRTKELSISVLRSRS